VIVLLILGYFICGGIYLKMRGEKGLGLVPHLVLSINFINKEIGGGVLFSGV
jgi:hypothetical protein